MSDFNRRMNIDNAPKRDEREETKQQAVAIIQRHLDSITEARKDTTGLGMIQHIIKMILAEVRGL